MSQEPVRLSAKGKGKKATSQHITFEVEEEGKPEPVSRSSVFNCLGTSAPRKSAFNRLSISLLTKEGTSRTCRSAFDTPRPKEGKSGLQKRKGTEVHNLIPSCMKCKLIVEVSTGNSLKVKRRTIVHTQELEKQVDDGEEDHETLVLPSCHMTAETDFESDASDDEPNEASRAIEDEGQATIDELKELNLGTDKEPRPIYVSSLLTLEEESKYFELLMKYKDMFTWTYKEMPGLDPTVVVHWLAIKQGVCPIKQTQCRFRPELLPQIEAEVNKLEQAGFIREVQMDCKHCPCQK